MLGSAFLEFYGLREQPFGATPDPRFLYMSSMHRETFASLTHGIEAGCGFLALIAHPGMGKTSLLYRCLERLQNKARTAFLFQTQCDSRQFLRFLLSELGIEYRHDDPVRMHQEFCSFLLRENRSGKRLVLIVDEAQNLDDAVLETVRLLSNFETPRSKLVQIVISGQPELAKRLAQPKLAQFRQRISIVNHLGPLRAGDIRQYIRYRLQVAGYVGDFPFTTDAFDLLAGASEGIPRKINNLCFHCMSLAYAIRQRLIESGMVERVLDDLDLEQVDHPERSRIPRAGDMPEESPAVARGGSRIPLPGIRTRDVSQPDPPTSFTKPAGVWAGDPASVAASVASAPREEVSTEPAISGSFCSTSPAPEFAVKPRLGHKSDYHSSISLYPYGCESEPGIAEAKGVATAVSPGRAQTDKPALSASRLNAIGSLPNRRRMRVGLILVLAVSIMPWTLFMSRWFSPQPRPTTSTRHDTESATTSSAPVLSPMFVNYSVLRKNTVSRVWPQYPRQAMNVPASAVLAFLVDKNGSVTSASLVSGERRLGDAALDAVLKWRFRPYYVGGEPVEVQTRVAFEYSTRGLRVLSAARPVVAE